MRGAGVTRKVMCTLQDCLRDPGSYDLFRLTLLEGPLLRGLWDPSARTGGGKECHAITDKICPLPDSDQGGLPLWSSKIFESIDQSRANLKLFPTFFLFDPNRTIL